MDKLLALAKIFRMGEERELLLAGYVIRLIRDEWMVSQARFAKLTGLSREWVVMTERADERRIRKKTLEGIAGAMGVSPREAMRIMVELHHAGFAGKERRNIRVPGPVGAGIEPAIDASSEQKVPSIPTFDLSVAAGKWVDAEELGEVRDPRQIDHGLFRIRIRGDSMTPRFKEGDTVEFQCLRDGKNPLEIGAFYYVQRDGQATFKQLARIKEDGIVLRALNKKKYPEPMIVERRSIVRMARAMAIIQQV